MPNVPVRSLVAVGIAGALALGCGAERVVGQYRSAHRGCAGPVTLTQRPGTQVFDAVGCGSRATVHRECTVGAQSTCLFAVSTYARRQAAFELACPDQELEETVLGDGRVGFTGCGRRAVYVQRADRWLSSRSSAAETH